MAVRMRRDVSKLADWDPILVWYAKAVERMRERELRDPRSWRYQAAIHDYIRSEDPAPIDGEQLPTVPQQRRFWRQCQHFTWFFLPWHRMYLLYFERIVAATIAELGGPPWALPYWNYSATGDNARRLPPAFRAERTPDGTPNPLRVEERAPGCNAGAVIADATDVNIRRGLVEPRFVAQSGGGNPGFGGARTGFNHSGSGSNVVGKVESTPHGSMHVAVGGETGWMSGFNTAGLDPIFWLHHANIDRLWTAWQRRNPNHHDPADALWRTSITFDFNDGAGNIVSHSSSEMVDSRVAPLEYDYEDVSDPVGGILEAVVPRKEEGMPEMVGATEQPVVLAGRPATTRLVVSSPMGPARPRGLEAAPAEPAEIYLNVENITSSGRPMSYAVYLNVPEGDTAEQHPELLAGVLPMFGVAEASRANEEHAGSGLHYALEVGDVVRTLRAQNAWDPNDVRITFVPKRRAGGLEAAPEAPAAPIQVGRVSLYFT